MAFPSWVAGDLITATKSNKMSLSYATGAAEIMATPNSLLLDGYKVFTYGKGIYEYTTSEDLIEDEDYVLPGDSGGQFIRQFNEMDLAHSTVGPDIIDTLRPISVDVNFSSISANSDLDSPTIDYRGARVGDMVVMNPPSDLEDGLIPRFAWVSARNTIKVNMHNVTGSGIDPAIKSWKFYIITMQKVPSISKVGLKFFEEILGGLYTDVTLEALLDGDLPMQTCFRQVCLSRFRRQALLDDTDARNAIEGSVIADGIMIEIDGSGY